MLDRFSSGQARKILEDSQGCRISQRCLDYWVEKGLVEPAWESAQGKGHDRAYSFQDLLRLSVIQKLRAAGLSLQKIREGVEILRTRGWTNPLDAVLITDGRTLFRRFEDGRVEDVLRRGQLVFAVVPVGRIRQELKTEVLKIEAPPQPAAKQRRAKSAG